MRPCEVDGLFAEDVNGSWFNRRHGVVREVHVEVEVADALEPAPAIQVARDGQWGDPIAGSCRAQAPLVLDGDSEPLHEGPRIPAEPLLPRHERVAVMPIFHLAL